MITMVLGISFCPFPVSTEDMKFDFFLFAPAEKQTNEEKLSRTRWTFCKFLVSHNVLNTWGPRLEKVNHVGTQPLIPGQWQAFASSE